MPEVESIITLSELNKLKEENTYLRTVNRGQAVSIDYLERENEQMINEMLKLARENDILTGQVFESPLAVRNEFVV